MHGSRSKIPSKESRPYIYDVKFQALLGAPYIYDISRVRVKSYEIYVIEWYSLVLELLIITFVNDSFVM
jgi:hypothetical protein